MIRISWGYKIAAVYTLFAIGILALVFKATSQHMDLVTPDYYEQELKYQDVINQRSAAARLSALPVYSTTTGTVQVTLPKEFAGKQWKGHIYLYRPSDASLDLNKDIVATGSQYTLVLPKPAPGIYSVKFSYELGGEKFFDEKDIRF